MGAGMVDPGDEEFDFDPREGSDSYYPNYRLKLKWGASVVRLGFSAIPSLLININAHVPNSRKLKPAEFSVLIAIVSFWWDRDIPPFPSIKTIARMANISDRQAKRVILSLVEKGFLQIVKNGGSRFTRNSYVLYGLVNTLERIAIHELKKRGRYSPPGLSEV